MSPSKRSAAPGAHWSLRGWLSRRLAAAAVLAAVCALGVGGVFVEASGARELVALVQEELDEALVLLRSTHDPVADLPDVALELAQRHPDVPMAWRLVQAHSGRVRARSGRAALFPAGPVPDAARDEPFDLGGGRLARVSPLTEDLEIQLVLDGSTRRSLWRHYWLAAGFVCAVAAGLSLLFGRMLARRVSVLLARAAQDLEREEHAIDLPEEVAAVRRALREELRRVRAHAEEARVFTAGLAHELRSPIQNLIGQAEVALMRSREAEGYRRILASQLDELGDLARAVDNLLAMCTRETDGEQAHETFDLAEELELRLQREQSRARRRSVEVELRHEGDTRIDADREALMRGLRNLVANAIDYSRPGGVVRVAVRGVGEDLEVVVDDTGPGVPPEERERIFEPFVRGRAGGNGRAGYGLGLAIAKTAFEAQGGGVVVEDAPGGGARFRVRLPRVAAAPEGGRAGTGGALAAG